MIYQLVVIQLFISSSLTGLIWLVQLVHYPGFVFLSEEKFQDFHKFHSKQISWLVIPLMISELAAAIYWIFLETNVYSWVNFIFVLIAWLSTFLLSVPLHNLLSQGMMLNTIIHLISTNWIRTFTWTCKSLFLLFCLLNRNLFL
ncbi:MAG: hypothetical protein MH321_10575 [Leptospiraceae bacterium]|nr:hypothetical protein [Leptospiraceae bacterium]